MNLAFSRVRDFLVSRRLSRSDAVVVKPGALYIWSNRAGIMMFVTLLILLLASINYEINLGFMATFMVAGVVCVSMFSAHSNLRGLGLRIKPLGSVFADDPCGVELLATNESRADAFAIYAGWSDVRVDGVRHGAQKEALYGQEVCMDVLREGSASAMLQIRFDRRGYAPLPTVKVWTNWPLGLFTAWTYLVPQTQVLVFPRPERNAPDYRSVWSGSENAARRGAAHVNEDPDGLKPYRRGDAFKSILWKKSATAMATGAGDFVVRAAETSVTEMMVFDIEHTGLSGAAGLDDKLSRVCAWVLRANQDGVVYGVRVNGHQVAPGSGQAHLNECLKRLALA